MSSPRYWTVICLLLLAAGALYRRGDKDHTPASTPLSEFPVLMGNMSSVDMPIDPEALAILGQGDFLNRVFSPPRPDMFDPHGEAAAGAEPVESTAVGLFIAYFPTQRTGQAIHSPQNCLPGSGWSFESSGTTGVTDSSGKRSEVGDYVIVNGRFLGTGRPVSWVAADIVRIENGRLAEHWDVLQDEATKAESKSGVPRFGEHSNA